MDVKGSVLVHRPVMILREKLVCLFAKTTFGIQIAHIINVPTYIINDLLLVPKYNKYL